MTVSVHQECAAWCSDYTAVSDEWWAELYAAGARVAVLQLQDAGPVPRSEVDALKAIGFRVFGAIRPSGAPLHDGLWSPTETAAWFFTEKRRLGLQGLAANFEQEIQKADLEGKGWSEDFARDFRLYMPTLPAQLSTYPVEGLNHAPYIARGFRVSVQTYSDTNLWEWTPQWIMDWCLKIGWMRGRIKVTVPVHTIQGQRASIEATTSFWKAGGEIGGTLFPINQAMPPADYLTPLIQSLLAAGVVR